MKLKLLLCLSIFAALGCQSSQPKQMNSEFSAAASDHVNYELQRGVASQERTYWAISPTSRDSFSVTGLERSTISMPIKVEQLISFEGLALRDGLCPEYTPTPGSCTATRGYYTCQGEGNGTSEAWDDFYESRTSEQKAKALREAIKGIGEVSAEKLVASGYFNRRPRSWSAFEAEITRAADLGVITKTVATMTIQNYAAENAKNLGYTAGAICSFTNLDCQPAQVNETFVPCKKLEKTQQTRVVQTRNATVQVDIANSVLQRFETDSFDITVNENNGKIGLTGKSTNFNNYSFASSDNLENSNVRISVQGVSRRLVALPSQVYTSSPRVGRNASGKLVVSFAVDPKYLPGSSQSGDTLEAVVTTRTCQKGLLGCKFGTKMVQAGQSQVFKVTNTQSVLNLDMSSVAGLLIEADVELRRVNSPYYSSNNRALSTTQRFNTSN